MKPLFDPWVAKIISMIGAFDLGLYCHRPSEVEIWRWIATGTLTLIFLINPKVKS